MAKKGSTYSVKMGVFDPGSMKGVRLVERDGPKASMSIKTRLYLKTPALRGITNSLDARPIKLKPCWVRLSSGSRVANKDGENAINKAHNLGPSKTANGLPIFHFGNNLGGPNSSRPHDPISEQIEADALTDPHLRSHSIGDR